MNDSWPFKLDHIQDWAFWKKAFTVKECNLIVDMYKKNLTKAYVFKASQTSKVRKSKIKWINPGKETDWIFKRLTDITTNLNDRFFQFDIDGLFEGLQYTNYTAPGNYYGKHVDRGFNTKIRKLSISIQLTNPKKYTGGDLNLHFQNKPVTMSKEQGTLVIFPSYVLHEVTPVITGERNSLVAWVSGKNFK